MAAAWHTHVDIESTNTNELVSKPDGGAQILWRGVGTWDDSDRELVGEVSRHQIRASSAAQR
jgi:hypothetical protein